MSVAAITSENTGPASALRHALGWLVFGNAAGLYLSLLLLFPNLQLAQWTYGRWVPVHLNVQLYGWTSLPLVAWLFSIYQVDSSKAREWAPAAVWAWTAALALGVFHWLGGATSGKIFLDWKDGALWGFVAAQVLLWGVLAAAWLERSHEWDKIRRVFSLVGLAGLALVPVSLVFAASPSVYPPVDRTTGGPTGSSLLGSSLIVVGLMLLLPRLAARPRDGRDRPPGGPCECEEDEKSLNSGMTGNGPLSASIHSPGPPGGRSLPFLKQARGIWMFFAFSWVVFGVTEAMGGTHFQAIQLGAMLMLLPWAWWLPREWSRFDWPEGSCLWRAAMFGWWGLLVVSGILMYQPGVLDHLKFTQGLVAHSHLAMAGFTTSFCALLLVLLTGKRIGGGWSVAVWHGAALAMIAVLAVTGWREGDGPSWMLGNPAWREWGLVIRAACGGLMLCVSVVWLLERRTR
jgi:cytochrome c oxidase cbb3-type subunit 1